MVITSADFTPLVNFIAEKSKHIVAPFNRIELCRQFKREIGSYLTVDRLSERIILLRDRIHEMRWFDMETRARMMFGLRASVDENFLNELKKVGHVEVDHQRRIIRYERKGGGFQVATVKRKLSNEIPPLMEFIAKKAKDLKSPMNLSELSRQFIRETNSPLDLKGVMARIALHRHKIDKMDQFDRDTKVKMMFGLSASVDAGFLKELQKVAEVVVDLQNRIVRYKHEKLDLGQFEDLQVDPPVESVFRLWESEPTNEVAPLMKFLVQNSEDLKSPMMILELCKRFKQETDSPLQLSTLVARANAFRQNLQRMEEFNKNLPKELNNMGDVGKPVVSADDAQTPNDESVQVYCSTALRRFKRIHEMDDEEYSTRAKQLAHMEVDSKQRIVSYKSQGSRLLGQPYERKPSKWHYSINSPEGVKLEKDILDFLAQKSKWSKTPLVGAMAKFKKKTKCLYSVRTLNEVYRRLKPTIYGSPNWDKKTKIKMMFVSRTVVSPEIVDDLRRDAYVEIDEKGRIDRYISNVGRFRFAALRRNSQKEKDNKKDLSLSTGRRLYSDDTSSTSQDVEDVRKKMKISEDVTVNILEFLAHLRSSAIPIFSHQIDTKIERMRGKHKGIPIAMIHEAVTAYLDILTSQDEMRLDHNEETVPLSDVINRLEVSLCYITHPLMDEFQKELRRLIIIEDHKDIALGTVRFAMETLLGKLVGRIASDGNDTEVKRENDDDFNYEPLNMEIKEEEPDDIPVNQESELFIAKDVPLENEPSNESSINLKNLLEILRQPVLALQSPSVTSVVASIDATIIENPHCRVEIEELKTPFEMFLSLLKKHAALKSDEENASLCDFLIAFKGSTSLIAHPSMQSFHQKLETSIVEFSDRDMRVPIRIICRAMTVILSCVLP